MININDKHAFLIMAYDDFDFLKELLKAIDDERNDIYIHIDKRSKCNFNDFKFITKRSNLIFVDRIKVTWGSQDQIKAEYILLKESTNFKKYNYYHLISGHDFPLVSQEEFHNFFKKNYGKQFIDCRYKNINSMLFRIRYYFPFQSFLSGKNFMNRVLNKIGVLIQKTLGINRLSDKIVYGYGGNWFSITDDFARYVVSMESFVKENFYKGLCADELFLQTLWLNSPMFDENKMFINIANNSSLEQNYRNSLRAVDFISGSKISPCTFNENDYELLKESNCLFARKLNSVTSKKLLKKIKKDIL